MSNGELSLDRIREAATRLAPHVTRTPLRPGGGGGLWLKCENRQVTGSFKARGALNRILGLADAEAARGVVAASAGNHGMGVALAARIRGCRATVVVPSEAVPRKVDGIRALGAVVVKVEGGYEIAEAAGQKLAKERGAIWVSPYNDAQVIAGQGTIGLEIAQDLADVTVPSVYVPVGGGGLISGIGIGLRRMMPRAKLVGAQPAHSPYMQAFFSGGDPATVVELPTAADGLAGPVEPGSITYALVSDVVDDIELVSEEEIQRALAWALRAGEVIEPSAAVALAAGLRARPPRDRIIVLSGGNIDPGLLSRLSEGRGLNG